MKASLALALALGTLLPATVPAATKYPEQKAKLEQQLKAQYPLTTLTRDGSGISKAGTVLVLQKNDLGAVPGNAVAYYTNNFKAGRLTHPALANMFFKPEVIKTFASGEQFFVMNFEAKDDAVVVLLFTYNTYDDMLYKADVQFQFPKGYLADVTLNQVQAAIGEVFAVAPPPPPTAEQTVPQPAQPAQAVEPAPAASVPGVYFRRDKTSDYIEFKTDGTLHLLQGGKNYDGNYEVNADTITIHGKRLPPSSGRLAGNTMVDPSGTVWEKQPTNSNPSPDSAVPAPPVEPAPPATPVTIQMGDSPDKVVAAMGQPERIAKVANKEIYFYKDMKVTFVNGVVSDIQ
jgi:hypothetical protein